MFSIRTRTPLALKLPYRAEDVDDELASRRRRVDAHGEDAERDAIVVTKLDRLARSVADLVRIVDRLTGKGIAKANTRGALGRRARRPLLLKAALSKHAPTERRSETRELAIWLIALSRASLAGRPCAGAPA